MAGGLATELGPRHAVLLMASLGLAATDLLAVALGGRRP
jgi:hypothetical protein